MMKKMTLLVILLTIVGSCFIHDAVIAVKQPAAVVPLKQPDASFKKLLYKENITADITDYQYFYGAGMPAMCNYY